MDVLLTQVPVRDKVIDPYCFTSKLTAIQDLEAIALYIFTGPSESKLDEPEQIVVCITVQFPCCAYFHFLQRKPKVIGNDATICETIEVDAHENCINHSYAIIIFIDLKDIIMPTLFDPEIERQFSITVASVEDKIDTFRAL